MTVPTELRECPVAPVVPTGTATQRDVARWAVALSSAHVACKTRLDAVDDILDQYEANNKGPK